jgi:hypothetical protein
VLISVRSLKSPKKWFEKCPIRVTKPIGHSPVGFFVRGTEHASMFESLVGGVAVGCDDRVDIIEPSEQQVYLLSILNF